MQEKSFYDFSIDISRSGSRTKEKRTHDGAFNAIFSSLITRQRSSPYQRFLSDLLFDLLADCFRRRRRKRKKNLLADEDRREVWCEVKNQEDRKEEKEEKKSE